MSYRNDGTRGLPGQKVRKFLRSSQPPAQDTPSAPVVESQGSINDRIFSFLTSTSQAVASTARALTFSNSREQRADSVTRSLHGQTHVNNSLLKKQESKLTALESTVNSSSNALNKQTVVNNSLLKKQESKLTALESTMKSSSQSLHGEARLNKLTLDAHENKLSLFARTIASVEAKFGTMVAKLTGQVSTLRGQVQLMYGKQISDSLQLRAKDAAHSVELLRMSEAMSGNITLYLETLSETITAAELNAAAALSLTRDFDVSIVSETENNGETVRLLHPWAALPAILVAEAVGDVDIANPTIKWRDIPADPAKFVKGILRLQVIFDTDAGATKTYVVDDIVTVEISATADDKLLGWTIVPVIKTYTVI